MVDVQWKLIGQVDVIGGSLVFPRASTAQGIYWFSVAKGSEVVAGYIGQTGRKNGLAGRFGNYRNRGNHPRDQHGKAVPLAARDDQLGTTSLNARRMLRAIEAGKTVAVSVLDGPDLAGGRGENAWRDELEADLIGQLCRSSVEVWNRRYVVDQAAREVREAGADEQGAALLARDPAAHAHLDDPGRVASLLNSLREAGAHDQAAALIARLPMAGMFELFLKEKSPADQFRFGREANGTPAAPWGWEDLD